MIKYLITDCKKIILYGDCHLEENGYWFPFRGRAIKVKILWLFWMTYRMYEVRQQPEQLVCNYCLEKTDQLPDNFGCKDCIRKYK